MKISHVTCCNVPCCAVPFFSLKKIVKNVLKANDKLEYFTTVRNIFGGLLPSSRDSYLISGFSGKSNVNVSQTELFLGILNSHHFLTVSSETKTSK